jgi:glycosyltransferase involved in cell wall biosynthesis
VPEVFESPWFYCLDTHVWNPDMMIPSNYVLPYSKDTIKIYHSVGNFESRSTASNKNIKCTHIYLPLIEKYKSEGLSVELLFFHGLPNKVVRYYQAQADIVVDMLTFGFFGANIREAMMLGIPSVCYLRPEWLDEMSKEIPGYVDELPVVSATPDSINEVLRDLISNKEKREEIGRRSRAFAIKWHGSETAARYFDRFLQLVIQENLNKKEVLNIQNEIY